MDPRLVKQSNATVGMANTVSAISNINARAVQRVHGLSIDALNAQGIVHEADPNNIVGALKQLRYKRGYLPKQPTDEKMKVFRTPLKHLQTFDKNGTRVIFENHFLVTADADSIEMVESLRKAGAQIEDYEGPWAEDLLPEVEPELTLPDSSLETINSITENLAPTTPVAGALVPTSVMPKTKSALDALRARTKK